MGLNKRAWPVVWLQVPPEKPLADGHFISGEPLQGNVYGLLQDIRQNRFLQYDGKAVNGGKIPALQGGVYDGG